MRRLIVAVLLPAVFVAGCTSSKPSSKSSAPPSSASGSAAASAGVATLAADLRKGVAGVTSAHLAVDAGALGGTIAGTVAIEGATSASDLTLTQSGSKTRVITVGSTSYAQVPSAHNTSGKPWIKVSETSKNEFVRALAGTLALLGTTTSVPGLAKIITDATTSAQDVGTATVSGATVEHWKLKIDPTKIGAASSLGALGKDPLPVDLYLDKDNRPARVTISIALGGQTLPLQVDITDYNAPVHITAPPPDQVSSD